MIRSGLKSQKIKKAGQEGSSEQKADFLIYPNPASELINIHYQLDRSSEWNILILNSQGIVLFNRMKGLEGDGVISLSVNSFPTGLYFIVFQNATLRKTLRFMVIR